MKTTKTDNRTKLFQFLKRVLPIDLLPDTKMTIASMLSLLEVVGPEHMPAALEILGAVPSTPSRTKFHCPILKEKLTTACQAKSCRYWTDYATADNCMLAFLNHHQQDCMSLTEISYVSRLTLTTVSRLHATGLLQMRQKVVDGVFRFDDLEQEFILQPNSHACVECEAVMSPADAAHATPSGFVWCSQECLADCHPDDVWIEHRFGVRTKRVLKFLTYKILGSMGSGAEQYVYDSGTLGVIAQTVGLSTQAIEDALKRSDLWMEKQTAVRPHRVWNIEGNKRAVRKVLGLTGTEHTALLNRLTEVTPGLDESTVAHMDTVCRQIDQDLRMI